jgi:hypothetical protein
MSAVRRSPISAVDKISLVTQIRGRGIQNTSTSPDSLKPYSLFSSGLTAFPAWSCPYLTGQLAIEFVPLSDRPYPGMSYP